MQKEKKPETAANRYNTQDSPLGLFLFRFVGDFFYMQ